MCTYKPVCVGDRGNDCLTFCTGDIQAKDTKITELQSRLKNNESKVVCIGVCEHTKASYMYAAYSALCVCSKPIDWIIVVHAGDIQARDSEISELQMKVKESESQFADI